MSQSSWLKKLLIGSAGCGVSAIALGTTFAAPSQATTLTGFTTTGSMMNGMEVKVNFLSGGSQTAIWGTTGYNAGGAFGNEWSLTQVGNTFGQPWTFSYSGLDKISSLVVNAVPGNTVFDRTFNGFGTPGSANGWDFQVISGQSPTSFAYEVPIDISVGDLFGSLALTWNNGFSGMMRFIAETDNGSADDPVKVAQSVPEPASVLSLLALGTLGASSMLKRKQKLKV
ncbi:hypothetical protein NIES2119_02125 [[Phormidium ambiguum] IAM M-71]|uniref:Ice-binding protein C-terminal domain-containing protein n=1 Tax=[Phormidium ambiguum] IAM M-71 TaxID=454136 RepID=A0A1U7ISP9_9CYAN|nr:PEP-CTERM sorting domain-containing protein [Phormidium ambiguum]OKH40443.1 hypothetical protein NIES2119_02125 [Phormidium ambiguum IAM M-71]